MMRTKSFLGWLDEGSNPNPMSVVKWPKANARGLIPENIYLVALDLTIFGIRSLNHEL